jgi:hypothetical protein
VRSTELLAFTATFQRVRTVFPLRADRGELAHVIDAYFRALSRFSLEEVTDAAERLITTAERFPKPVEWVRAIPKVAGAHIPLLSPDEAVEHRDAIARHYQGDPCRCHMCQQADVTHRFLRYVPDEDADGRDLKGILDGKIVARGHWAHGHELQRWYEARDRYFALRVTHTPKTMPAIKPYSDPDLPDLVPPSEPRKDARKAAANDRD